MLKKRYYTMIKIVLTQECKVGSISGNQLIKFTILTL